jgi:hypothetical protein
MDITSPTLLKIKGLLFLLLGILAAWLLALLIGPMLSWRVALAFAVAVWAFCRFYYFCFYVLEHYADPHFKYAGIMDAAGYLVGIRKQRTPKESTAR